MILRRQVAGCEDMLSVVGLTRFETTSQHGYHSNNAPHWQPQHGFKSANSMLCQGR